MSELVALLMGFAASYASWYIARRNWIIYRKGRGGDRGYPEFKHLWRRKPQ